MPLSPLFCTPVVLPSANLAKKRKKGLTSMTVTVPSQAKRADKLLEGSNLGSRKGLEASLKFHRENAYSSSGPGYKGQNY